MVGSSGPDRNPVARRMGGGSTQVLGSFQLAEAVPAGTRHGTGEHAHASHVYLPGPELLYRQQAWNSE